MGLNVSIIHDTRKESRRELARRIEEEEQCKGAHESSHETGFSVQDGQRACRPKNVGSRRYRFTTTYLVLRFRKLWFYIDYIAQKTSWRSFELYEFILNPLTVVINVSNIWKLLYLKRNYQNASYIEEIILNPNNIKLNARFTFFLNSVPKTPTLSIICYANQEHKLQMINIAVN